MTCTSPVVDHFRCQSVFCRSLWFSVTFHSPLLSIKKISISFHSIILIIPKRNKHFKKWSVHEKLSCITDGLCITRVVIVPYINKTGGNHRWPKPVLFRLSPTRNPIQERTSPFFTSYYNDTTYRNAFHSARIIPHCKYWYLQRRPNQQSRYGIIS